MGISTSTNNLHQLDLSNAPLYILSHDNSIDEFGRSVCKRASKINSYLLVNGVRTYFGNYEETCDLDATKELNVCFILFLTKKYVAALLMHLEKNYKLTEVDYVPGKFSNFVEVTIRMIISRRNAGSCRIIPIIMEDNCLELLSKDSFDDMVIKFNWDLNHCADDSFVYVTEQLLAIIKHWTLSDEQFLSHSFIPGISCDEVVKSSAKLSSPGNSGSIIKSADANLLSTASFSASNTRSPANGSMTNKPWSSYKRTYSQTPVVSPPVIIPKQLPVDLYVDSLPADSVVAMDRSALYDWLVKYFDSPSLASVDKQLNEGTSGAIIIGWNFNRVEHIIQLLIDSQIDSLSAFLDFCCKVENVDVIYMKYFKSKVIGASVLKVDSGVCNTAYFHAGTTDSIPLDSASELKNHQVLENQRDDKSRQRLLEVLRMYIPAVNVTAVIKPTLSDPQLYATHTIQASVDNCVLFATCPVIVTASSTIQEIGLVLQLCNQCVRSNTLLVSKSNGKISGASGYDENQHVNSPLAATYASPLQQAVVSKLVLSSIPTLSSSHPKNVRLAEINRAVVSILYSDEAVRQADQRLKARLDIIASDLKLTPHSKAHPNYTSGVVSTSSHVNGQDFHRGTRLTPIPSDDSRMRKTVAASTNMASSADTEPIFSTVHREVQLDAISCLMVQVVQELSIRFTSFITNRIIADDSQTPPRAAFLPGATVAAAVQAGGDPSTHFNPMEEWCGRWNGMQLLCDGISAFVKLNKYLRSELSHRQRTQPRKYYNARGLHATMSLLDDDYLESQRYQLYRSFSISALTVCNCLFSKLSVTPPVAGNRQIPVTSDGSKLTTGDWQYGGIEAGEGGYDCYDQVDYTGAGESSPYKAKSKPSVNVNLANQSNSNAAEFPTTVSILLRLLYSHNVNNILASVQYDLCDSLVALIKPSMLSPMSECNQSTESDHASSGMTYLLSILYNVALLHLTTNESACHKLGQFKLPSIIEFQLDSLGVQQCAVYRQSKWPVWLLPMYQHVGLYQCIWTTIANLCVSDSLSRLQFGASKVCCEQLIVGLCHGYQQLFQYYDEIIEIELNVTNPPALREGSNWFKEVHTATAIPSRNNSIISSNRIPKDELEILLYNMLVILSLVCTISDESTRRGLPQMKFQPSAVMFFLEELLTFDVIRFMVQSIYNCLSTAISSANSSLDRMRHVPPADVLTDDKINPSNLYIVVGVCKALHGLCINSERVKTRCIDNCAIKILSNAFSIVYKDQDLVIEVIAPLLCMVLVNNSAAVAVDDSTNIGTSQPHSRKQLFRQFCDGNGQSYFVSAMQHYYSLYIGKLPLLPGSVDVCQLVIRDLLILLFWVLYHGNHKPNIDSSVYNVPDSSTEVQNTPQLVMVLCSSGICDVISKMFVLYVNRLLEIFRYYLPQETTDDCSAATRMVSDDESITSSTSFAHHAHHRYSHGVDDNVSTQSMGAVHVMSQIEITDEELITLMTVDYMCKIMCFLVGNESCRVLLGTSDGFCQSLLNVLTLACKLMMVYEKMNRESNSYTKGISSVHVGAAGESGLSERQLEMREAFKTSLIYIVSQCCFILRALTVESCNQTNILKQPVDTMLPQNVWGGTLGRATRTTDNMHLDTASMPAFPFSTWYTAILSVMELYMFTYTLPVSKTSNIAHNAQHSRHQQHRVTIGRPVARQLHTEFDDNSSASQSTRTDDPDRELDDFTESDYDESSLNYSVDESISFHQHINELPHQWDGQSIQSDVSDASVSRVTTTLPLPRDDTLRLKTSDLNSPTNWCSAITDKSLDHILHATLYLTCGTGLSAHGMDILFGHFHSNLHGKEALHTHPTASASLTMRQQDACDAITMLFHHFITFIRLFTATRSSLTLVAWEIMRRQCLIWLFPYHNTTIPESFLHDNQHNNSSNDTGGTSKNKNHRHATNAQEFGSSPEKPVETANAWDDDHSACSSVISFDGVSVFVENSRRRDARDDDQSIASSASYIDRNYQEKMEENVIQRKTNHHNNRTSSSMKYLAALRPNISISNFLPFKSTGRASVSVTVGIGTDELERHDQLDREAAIRPASLLDKVGSWFVSKRKNKRGKGSSSIHSDTEYKKQINAVDEHGAGSAPGAHTVANKHNPIHHVLWHFHHALNQANQDVRSAPHNHINEMKHSLSRYGHGKSSEVVCIYDMIYYILAASCGLPQFSASAIMAIQMLIIILQGYIHDKDAFRQLCKVLYQRKIFDVCMKYLLVIYEPPLNDVTIEGLAFQLAGSNQVINSGRSSEHYGRNIQSNTVVYLGKTYLCSPVTSPAALHTFNQVNSPTGKPPTGRSTVNSGGSRNPLSAVPIVNHQVDPLSQFIDMMDCGFPTVRSQVEGQSHRHHTAAQGQPTACPLYPEEIEMDFIKYIASLCSYAAVDEDTRYILGNVLYTGAILEKISHLPRYDLSASQYVEPDVPVEPLSSSALVTSTYAAVNEEAAADRIRKQEWEEMERRRARQEFIPVMSTKSHLPLHKIQQIRKVIDTVEENLAWKDPRLYRYQQLDEVLSRMSIEFRGKNATNTDVVRMVHTREFEVPNKGQKGHKSSKPGNGKRVKF